MMSQTTSDIRYEITKGLTLDWAYKCRQEYDFRNNKKDSVKNDITNDVWNDVWNDNRKTPDVKMMSKPT